MGPVILAVVFLYASLSAQGTDVGLNGTWTLNKTLSEFPPEPGFTADWVTAASAPDGASGGGGRGGGGRGGRRGGGGGSAGPAGITPVRESAEDAARIRLFNAELRNPAASLKIVETADAVTITDAGGSRTLHPNDRAEALSATDSKLPDIIVTAQREGAALVVTYNVEANRQLKYIYSAGGSPRQLTVDAEIHERKNVTRVHRVYDQGTAAETAPPPGAGAPAAASPPAGASGSGGRGPGSNSEKFDQRPDAELRGLNVVGLVVEELSPQASACGLNHDTIDNEVYKRLTDAGLRVNRHSDDDTFVYVNIMTTSASNGLCVSRFDVWLYSHTTARLSHTAMPVLVQAELAHSGGIAGGGAATHAAAVQRGLDSYVDEITERIRAANAK